MFFFSIKNLFITFNSHSFIMKNVKYFFILLTNYNGVKDLCTFIFKFKPKVVDYKQYLTK